MSKDQEPEISPITAHPPPGPAFKEWFARLSSLITNIRSCEIFSGDFVRIANSIQAMNEEIVYEYGSKADRKNTSVYDRSDYIVRELLRTTKINHIIQYFRSTSSMLANGKLSFNADGALTKDSTPVSPLIAITLLVRVPTLLSLCFTAEETIGVVSPADIIKISSDILEIGKTITKISIPIEPPHVSIFFATPLILKDCMEHLKILNTSLFFSLFEEEKIFKKLIELALQAHKNGQNESLNIIFDCISVYIQSSQSERDRKKLETDSEFVTLYKQMLDDIINPQIKCNRSNRSKFRSILFFSRSLRS